jgi:cysteine desulfurase
MSSAPVYLDHAATTPVRPEVREAMLPFLTDEAFGNPSSAHRFGRAARAALETARRRVAAALGAEPSQVVFTSGGTEADNLAVVGAALAARARGGAFRVAVSALEHKAVLEAAEAVEHLGGEMIVLPVDRTGNVDPEALEGALRRGVALVSVMWVNNETGVMPDVAGVAARCAAEGVPFHTDAVQAIGRVPCEFGTQPAVTLLTISGHKIGAPKGIGALVLRGHDTVEPLLHGGGQQRGVRPGTENVAGAVALGEAVTLAVAEQERTAAATRALRDDLERRLAERIPDLHVNGQRAVRAPHISSVCVPGADAESLLVHLDMAGIACSSGSACSTGSVSVSHVLAALGVPPELALGSLRFSFWRTSTPADVDRVAEVLPGIVERVRKLAETLGR